MVQNSVNGRERYFNNINFHKKVTWRSHGPVVRSCTFFAGGSWDARSNPPVTITVFFFLSSFFLPFSFLLFILTADPLSFARFLRKRISSTTIGQSPILNIILRDRSYTNSKAVSYTHLTLPTKRIV